MSKGPAIAGPFFVMGWSGQRESNPHEQLGKLPGYHYIMPAVARGLFRAGRAVIQALIAPWSLIK